MSTINRTVCDGPNCKNEVDHNSCGAPTYHRLYVGGSDFSMSFGSPEERELDFCCFECLKAYVDEVCESRKNEAKSINNATKEINKLFKEGVKQGGFEKKQLSRNKTD